MRVTDPAFMPLTPGTCTSSENSSDKMHRFGGTSSGLGLQYAPSGRRLADDPSGTHSPAQFPKKLRFAPI
jgi:hypothetical protein